MGDYVHQLQWLCLAISVRPASALASTWLLCCGSALGTEQVVMDQQDAVAAAYVCGEIVTRRATGFQCRAMQCYVTTVYFEYVHGALVSATWHKSSARSAGGFVPGRDPLWRKLFSSVTLWLQSTALGSLDLRDTSCIDEGQQGALLGQMLAPLCLCRAVSAQFRTKDRSTRLHGY